MCVCVCVLTHKGSQGSVLMCYRFPLLTEGKNIHMIDVFVFLPFARLKKKKDGGADIDVGRTIKRLIFAPGSV